MFGATCPAGFEPCGTAPVTPTPFPPTPTPTQAAVMQPSCVNPQTGVCAPLPTMFGSVCPSGWAPCGTSQPTPFPTATTTPTVGVALPNNWTAHSTTETLPGTSVILAPDVSYDGNSVTITSNGARGAGGWVWSMIACHSGYGCQVSANASDNAWLLLIVRYSVSSSGMARGIVQLGFADAGTTKWYELDLNVIATASWPRPDLRPAYYWIAPLGTYDIAGGPHYYAVLDGSYLGQKAPASTWVVLAFPIGQYARKVQAENGPLFPTPGKLNSYAVAVEARDNGIATVSVEDMVLVVPPTDYQIRKHLSK
jgi:hypothetical protein